jgi:hypothetical protein
MQASNSGYASLCLEGKNQLVQQWKDAPSKPTERKQEVISYHVNYTEAMERSALDGGDSSAW